MNWMMQLQCGLKTHFTGGKCMFIISGIYLDYKEVALVSAVKEMTLITKKVTSPSF